MSTVEGGQIGGKIQTLAALLYCDMYGGCGLFGWRSVGKVGIFLNDMTHSGTQQTKHTRKGVKKEGRDILPMWQERIEGRMGRKQDV